MATTLVLDKDRKRTAARLLLPQKVKGRYRSIKTAVATLLLGFYFLMPWIRWDRGPALPDQAVLFDLPNRRLFIFGLEFWPQDLPIAVGALILGAFALFYATTLAGRVWCGFTCPQTVWTDLFNGVDRVCERLLGRATAAAKALRTGLWIVIAIVTGFGFTAYFDDAMTLPMKLVTGEAPLGFYITIGVLTMSTWMFAGYARERVCLHMCPWPRFQAALLDRDSMVVTYQGWRGEPRGKKKAELRTDLVDLDALVREAANFDANGRGDCIDCFRCVNVCPTGVDIREGLQMGCIGCGLCIDACNDVMTKVERPKGLIRFDNERSEARRSPLPANPNYFRAKSILYALACLTAAGATAFGIVSMPSVTADIDPERNPPFIQLSDGSVRNDYEIRMAHRLRSLDGVVVTSEGLPGATLRLASQDVEPADTLVAGVGATRQLSDRLMITVPRDKVPSSRTPLIVELRNEATGEVLSRLDTYFWGPQR